MKWQRTLAPPESAVVNAKGDTKEAQMITTSPGKSFSEGFDRGLAEGHQRGVAALVVLTIIAAAIAHSPLASGSLVALGLLAIYGVSRRG